MHGETGSDSGVTMRVPFQAVPVDRTAAGTAAFGREAGVDASVDWGSLLMDNQVNTAFRPFVQGIL